MYFRYFTVSNLKMIYKYYKQYYLLDWLIFKENIVSSETNLNKWQKNIHKQIYIMLEN